MLPLRSFPTHTGALAGIVIIPIAVAARRKSFNKRVDLVTDDVPLLFEKFWMLKASLDASLCVILIAGKVMMTCHCPT